MSKTLIVIILDKSLSMKTRKEEVVSAYNELIENQKTLKNDSARLALITFNDKIHLTQQPTDLNNIKLLTIDNYDCSGFTALYDAIVYGIKVADEVQLPDEQVIMSIITDGENNASRKYNYEKVKKKILTRQRYHNFTFLYIGEDIDKYINDGIFSPQNSKSFDVTDGSSNLQFASNAMTRLRSEKNLCQRNIWDDNYVSNNWN